MNNIELGKKIKKFRKLKNITQRQLADKIGYSQTSTITKIENGSISISNNKVYDIAKALNISVTELLEDKTPDNFVDLSVLSESQMQELNAILTSNTMMFFNGERELSKKDKAELEKALTKAYVQSIKNKNH